MAMGDRYTRLLMGLPNVVNPYDIGSDIMQQGMLGYEYGADQPSSGVGQVETAGPRFADDAAHMQFFNSAPFGSVAYLRSRPGLGGFGYRRG